MVLEANLLHQRRREESEQLSEAEGCYRACRSRAWDAGKLFLLPGHSARFLRRDRRQPRAAGLKEEGNGRWRRVIIEKPFGHDLETARGLNLDLKRSLEERQIYRIDHYLGKETVQNILVFRFGNGIFEPVWNRRYIDNVQITAAESVGVEKRGG